MFRYTRRLITYFNSRIRFKIILPFALLTLMVAVTGTYLSTRLVATSLAKRIESQLTDAGRAVAGGLALREQLHLSALRTIAFTVGIDEAIMAGDQAQLQNLLFPLIANNNNIDRVDVINADGLQLLTIYRPPGTNSVGDYVATSGADLTGWLIVDKVLNGAVDSQGDKYATLANVDGHKLFLTAGPVKQGDRIMGAVVVSSYVQDLLDFLKQENFEISLYNLDGQLIGTTISDVEEASDILTITPKEARPLLALEGVFSTQRSVSLGGQEYDVVYSIFEARNEPLGFFSVAMQTAFMVAQGTTARNQMILIFATALLLVFGIGYAMANTITGRLQHLMENAMAVASGDFTKRTHISANDEIGSLARSLDHMTGSLSNYTNALQDRIDELIALYESSSAVTIKSGLNLDHVLQAVAASVKGAIRGTDQVTVYLLDESGQTLVPRVSTPPGTGISALAFSEEGGMCDLLATTKPQVISTSDLKVYAQGYFSINGASDVLVASLIAGQKIIGMLALIPTAGRPRNELLNSDTERLLGTLANQSAIAIKNAQLFEATQQAYEELRKLDDLKTEFINIAAHELRTPLGAMMGYASFVQKRVPPKLQKTMDFLVVSTLRMRTMVDAMLTIQRLDAGKAFLRVSTVHIQDILRKSAADFRPMAELEGHTMIVDLPDDLPSIQGDAEKIDLVFSNLVSNAIKFTPKINGHIEVVAQDYGESILLTVCDNGVGIAAENQERIFERFYQARVDHIAGHGGMGLGLTTVKHLVELHGGQVWVESEVGKGSKFFATFPKITPADSTEALTRANIQLIEEKVSVAVLE